MTQANVIPSSASEAPAPPPALVDSAPAIVADAPRWPSSPVAGAAVPAPTATELAALAQRAAQSGDRRDLSRYLEARRKR